MERQPRRRRALALHRQLLHAIALRRRRWPPGIARQGFAEKAAVEVSDTLVRGGRRSLAWAAHGVRPLVYVGIPQQFGCGEPGYRMRLGRVPHGTAARYPECET